MVLHIKDSDIEVSDIEVILIKYGKDKEDVTQSLYRPGEPLRLPEFLDNRHMKVLGLSALLTVRLYPPRNISGTHFCWRLSQPQGHSAARRIMSIKNSSDTIANRTRDLLACSAVPQPTAPPCNSD
jgi:hypothetical protein